MNKFWLRFGVFCLLWALMIVQDSEKIPISILLFAAAAGIYFFLSIGTAQFLLYLCLTGIILTHDIVVMSDSTYTILLLLFISIVAAFHLNGKQYTIYMITNLVLSILISFNDKDNLVEMVCISIFFYFLVLASNRMSLERNEQKEIYEQLMGEYRQLKRMNLVAEHDARLAERTKIARDIHDSVGHRLTALIMKLEMLAIQHDNSLFRELKQMAIDSLDETRKAVKALQAEENEGLASVVHLIRKLEAESHILVQFTTKQGVLSVPLSNEKNIVLYRVIQEALTNAMRHAGSREVQITLGKSADGAVSFEIKNLVFDAKPFEFGFGLTNMKERIDVIRGKLEVFQTGEQFVVSGSIPSE